MADQIDTSGDLVNVVNPDGKLVALPSAQVQSALAAGYRHPAAGEVDAASEKETYGKGISNELKAAALGAAGSFSFGVIPEALAATGVVPSAEQGALAKYNPISRGLGVGAGILGGIGAAAMTGGASAAGMGAEAGGAKLALGAADLLNPIGAVGKIGKAVAAPIEKALIKNPEAQSFANALLARGAGATAGGAAEGALFGAGQAVDEHAMGDPGTLGEHLVHNIGFGSILGGLAGGAFSAAGSTLSKIKGASAAPAEVREAVLREGIREGAAKEAAIPGMVETPTSVPTSLGEIKERIKGAAYQGVNAGELPAKQALVDAAQTAGELQYPVTNIQLESLSDARMRDYYKGLLESQSDEAQALKTYESLQKRELTGKVGSEVRNIAPTESLTHDAVKGGEGLVKDFTEQYQTEKEALAPLFKKFDEAGIKGIENPQDLISIVDKSIPGAGNFIKVGAEGAELMPYKASMPFSKTAYNAIKDLVVAANDETLTLGGLRNVRESMRDSINWMSAPRESAQIGSLRKGLMDYLEEQVQRAEPNLAVRDTFKRYAVNEEQRSVLEKIFGGSISDKASFAKEIKSEDVLDKLFANSVSVKAAKDLLPANVFNKAVGNYLSHKISQVTDVAKNGFSSNKFATFIKSKEPELMAALSDNPQVLNKLRSYADIMRILPDSPSINPSGTAKTLNILETIHKIGGILSPGHAAREAVGDTLKEFSSKAENKRVAEVMNQVLAGKNLAEAEKAADEKLMHRSVLGAVQKAYDKGKAAIKSGAEAIFDISKKVAPAAAGMKGTKREHKDIEKDLHSMINDPETLLHHMDDMTKTLFAFAPNTAGSFQQTSARAAQFLQSKLPPKADAFPLSPDLPHSQAQLAKFSQYYHAIENPMITLAHIKEGRLTSETVAAVSSVYPKLYQDMQAQVVEQMTKAISKKTDIPYHTKMSLTLFMGSPMDATMSQEAILGSQPKQGQPAQTAQAGGAPQGGKSMKNLGKMNSMYATATQARETERAKG